MRTALILIAMILIIANAFAGTDDFDQAAPGTVPPDWTCGVTGGGSPVWKVESDPSAPSQPHALKQSGIGTFPWCVKPSVSMSNGYVEVKFKPLGGQEDQVGGLVWRWKDGDTYYVARANAIENNVSLYYTERGRRHTIKSVDATIARNQWHTLRVEFAEEAIKTFLDGKQYIELNDAHLSGAGAVGVWTKADSVTEFDDFAFGSR